MNCPTFSWMETLFCEGRVSTHHGRWIHLLPREELRVVALSVCWCSERRRKGCCLCAGAAGGECLTNKEEAWVISAFQLPPRAACKEGERLPAPEALPIRSGGSFPFRCERRHANTGGAQARMTVLLRGRLAIFADISAGPTWGRRLPASGGLYSLPEAAVSPTTSWEAYHSGHSLSRFWRPGV